MGHTRTNMQRTQGNQSDILWGARHVHTSEQGFKSSHGGNRGKFPVSVNVDETQLELLTQLTVSNTPIRHTASRFGASSQAQGFQIPHFLLRPGPWG